MANFSPSAAEEMSIMGRVERGQQNRQGEPEGMAQRRKPREGPREESLDGSRERKGTRAQWDQCNLCLSDNGCCHHSFDCSR